MKESKDYTLIGVFMGESEWTIGEVAKIAADSTDNAKDVNEKRIGYEMTSLFASVLAISEGDANAIKPDGAGFFSSTNGLAFNNMAFISVCHAKKRGPAFPSVLVREFDYLPGYAAPEAPTFKRMLHEAMMAWAKGESDLPLAFKICRASGMGPREIINAISYGTKMDFKGDADTGGRSLPSVESYGIKKPGPR